RRPRVELRDADPASRGRGGIVLFLQRARRPRRRRRTARPPGDAVLALERAFEHLDDELTVGSARHRRHVEAHGATARVVLGEPPSRECAKASLLARRDCLDRRTELGARARLHLAEDERGITADDHVELAVTAAPVAVEHLVRSGFVPPRNGVLARVSESTARVDPASRARAGHGYRSLPASSSTLTSLNVTTRTLATNRAGRYMSHTHASW